MKTSIKILTCALSAALLAGTVSAQNQTGNADDQSTGGSQSKLTRVSRVIDAQAKSTDGQNLGTIQDVVVTQEGQVFAWLNLGNNRYSAVPFQLINSSQARQGGREVTVNATQKKLMAGPLLKENAFGSLRDSSFTQKLYSHYNLQPAAGMGSPGTGSDTGFQGQGQESSAAGSNLEQRLSQINTAAEKPAMLNQALQRISTQTGVPLEQIRSQHEQHPEFGIGGLLVANSLAAATKKDPQHFIDQRLAGKSWTSIAQENNVSMDDLMMRVDRVASALTPSTGTEK